MVGFVLVGSVVALGLLAVLALKGKLKQIPVGASLPYTFPPEVTYTDPVTGRLM